MGLEEVKKEVIDNAKSKANIIITEARKAEEGSIKEAKNKIKKLEEHYNSELEKLRDSMEIREIASAKLESKRQLLELKKDLVDKAFDKAVELIKKLSKKEKSEIINKLVKKARNEITIGKIYCNNKDKDIMPSEIEIGDSDILGGVVAENKDGTVQIDLSYDTLLSNIKEKYLTEISKTLFEK